jgi:Arc/MetJ-type ribon-helix-helix transcriptional regulator
MEVALPPELVRFVDEKLKDGRFKEASNVLIEALRQFEQTDRAATSTLGGLAGADIEAEAFVVLFEATKSADQDLKAIMANVKAITNAKQGLRDLISKVNKDVAANTSRVNKPPRLDFSTGMGTEEAYHHAPIPVPDPTSVGGVRLVPTDLHTGNLVSVAELKTILDELIGQLDSMSELSEMESLRLQMAMDRRSKFISTLSNIMKKISKTADTLVQNLK